MKKRKRSSKNKTLTQEEIWDDSALLESWEEAAEEYKLYHSIRAKGQRVEDVLREAEESNGNEDDMQIETGPEPEEARGEEMVANASSNVIVEDSDENIKHTDTCTTTQTEDGTAPEVAMATDQTYSEAPASGSFAGMPQMVLNGAPNPPSIQDEGLKNLMMSWYFAGYYTGLYEGQQRAVSKQ
ncbi:hypothetical protein MferCBS31731_005475 [Microsporum ferrugineum]